MTSERFASVHQLVNYIYDLNFKGSGSSALALARLLLPSPVGSTVVTTCYNFSMVVNPLEDNFVERSIYYTGTYEKGTLFVMQHLLKPGDKVVDAGAHIGLMSLFAARIVGKQGAVFAFEPVPTTHQLLLQNIALNGFSQIYPYKEALGETQHLGQMSNNQTNNRGTFGLITESEKESEVVEVLVKSLDTYTEIGEIQLLKADVEGHELQLLKGARSKLSTLNPPALILECGHLSTSDQHDLFDFIKGVNEYRIFKLKGTKRKISPLLEVQSSSDLPEEDNIFCLTTKHLSGIPNTVLT